MSNAPGSEAQSRSSSYPGSTSLATADRAAVEPVAALVAVLVVGLALGLYVTALGEARPDDASPTAETALDRAERSLAVGGVVDPGRMRAIEEPGTATAIELEADGERWLAASDGDAPGPPEARSADAVVVAERPVTVRVAPGRNVRGTLRAVVWR